MLLKRRGAERTPASYGPIDGPGALTLILNCQLDSRADGGAVGFYAHQFQADPIVAIARVLEETHDMGVAGSGSADDEDDVFVTTIIHVGKCDAVAFVPVAGAGGCGDIHEAFAAVVAKQDATNQRSVGGIAVTEKDVKEAVVIDVAEICTHRHEDFVQADLGGDITEGAVAHVLEQLERGCIVVQAEVGTGHFVNGGKIAGDKQIRPSVIVIIEEPGGKAASRSSNAGGFRYFRKRVVVIVVVEKVGPG